MANGTFTLGTSVRRAKPAPKRRNWILEPQPFIPLLPAPTGWLLRKDLGLCETIMLNNRKNITAVIRYLKESLHDKNKYNIINQFCPQHKIKQEMIKRCLILAEANQRLRVAFSSLARKWLFKHIKKANEEDLLTGEVPKKLVTFYDWEKRSAYHFEAMTILRDMTSRLMNHSYLFPKFLIPRNPYTNIGLNVLQFFSIMRQLHAHGMTNWKLEALLEAEYSMTVFKEKFGEPIKREIIEKQFADLKSDETISIILEFIEDQHTLHGQVFNEFIYGWTLKNTNCSALRMKFWIMTCKKYNMISATVRDPQQLILETTQLELSTKKFCGVPIELIKRREAEFKKTLMHDVHICHIVGPRAEHDEAYEELEGLITSMSINNDLQA
jgi:hypothetical protein